MIKRLPKHLLNLAGEHRVCSELHKRGIFATITMGHHKGVDILALNENSRQHVRIEVKTSQRGKFVTSISQKSLHESGGPDFWVLFLLRRMSDDSFEERFFILTQKEICALQKKINTAYRERNPRKAGAGQPGRGVDNIKLKYLDDYEGKWEKLKDALQL